MCKKTKVLLVRTLLVFITLAACKRSKLGKIVEPETVIVSEGPVDRISPAEIYCTGLGYEYITREIKINNSESQINASVEPVSEPLDSPHPGNPVVPDYILQTVCAFPDRKECEEIEFLAGRCGQEYSYCVKKGYKLEKGENGANCIFPEGTSCQEFDFFNGDCGPATSQ